MTKFLIFLFCGLLSVTGCSVKQEQDNGSASLIASGTTGALTWELSEDGTLTISGKGVIPDYRNVSTDKPWTVMPWYDRSDEITSVIIGNDVSNIGYEAFFNCSNLTKVVFGNSVDSIGNGAFARCNSLTAIDIPGSVTKIGAGAFGESGLTTVIIPNSVTFIADHAFADCSSLTSVSIASSVDSIGAGAFRCNSLKEIVNYRKIPQNLNMGEYPGAGPHHPGGGTLDPFNFVDKTNCILWVPDGSVNAYRAAEGWKDFSKMGVIGDPASITTVNVNQSGTTGALTWELCSDGTLTISGKGEMPNFSRIGNRPPPWDYLENSILKVVIEDDVTRIGTQAFSSYSNVTAVSIGSSVTSIGTAAFAGCTSLSSVTIPKTVSEIENRAFTACSGLVEINVDVNNSAYCSKDGVVYSKDEKTLVQYPGGKTETYFDVPASVTHIGVSAFASCSNLTSLTVGNSVTSIGEWAVFNCESLASLTVGNLVTCIGQRAFENCYSLSSVTIPEGVTTLDGFVFLSCRGLTSVSISSSVATIGMGAFSSCSSLTEIINHRNAPQELTLDSKTFFDVNKAVCVLLVPAGAVEAYRAAEGWKDFENIKEIQ